MIIDVLIQNIKETAKDFDIPLKVLAEKIGMTEQGLHGMFRKKSIKLETIEKIADVLNVSVSDLFDEGEQDSYWKITEEIDNAKIQIRRMAIKGKGVIDLDYNIGTDKINLDFAELKQNVPINYYEEYDKIFKQLDELDNKETDKEES